MSECPIFVAAGLMERVWREVEHLCDAIIAGLEREGFETSYAGEQVRAEVGATGYAHNYELSGVYRHQRRPAHLLLDFDFYRSGPVSGWAPGSTALLIVGYGPSAADPWFVDDLAFDSRGQMSSADVAKNLKPTSGSGCRLLGFADEEGSFDMAKRSWLFAVPLSRLSGPPDVARNVVTPLVALLRREGADLSPLRASDAVEWP